MIPLAVALATTLTLPTFGRVVVRNDDDGHSMTRRSTSSGRVAPRWQAIAPPSRENGICRGSPRLCFSVSSTRTTRMPASEVSTSIARHFRV